MFFLSGISSFVKEHSEVIHGVLDVAGFIPGLGTIPDLANAALYAAEGNVKEFVWSVASAVPLIGDTIGLAGKTGKVVKIAEKGADGIDAINSLEKAKNIETVLSKTGGKAVTGALSIKSGTKDVNTAFDIIKNETKEICTNRKCFTGDTLIYTSNGYKVIKEIKKGDEVYSRNIETGETGVKEVEEVFCTTAHTIYHICVDSKEEIKTTAYHPFYIQGQGWITAINLCEGDILETMDGTLNITGIVRKRHEKPVIVYNFHVKDWRAYFVSKIKAYVHNSKGEYFSSKKTLFDALKDAPVKYRKNPKTGMMEPDMKQIQVTDDYKVILRKDVGDFNHGDLEHWNFEIQTVKGGSIKYNLHLYLGDDGNILPFTKDNIYS